MEGTMLQKWNANAPYHLFYNVIPASPNTYQQANAIKFTDLLCPSLGKLKCTLQLTSFVDFDWLFDQYQQKGVESLPLTIIMKNPKRDDKISTNFVQINYYSMPNSTDRRSNPHHSKSGIYAYDDGSLRIVVSTANLCGKDWDHYNNGIWISPPCPPMSRGSGNGESPTGFKSDLLTYLKSYKLTHLTSWIARVENADFSDIRVFLVTSVPGIYVPGKDKHNGCHRLTVAIILKNHLLPESRPKEHVEWKVIAQSSNIGQLGSAPGDFLQPVLGCLTNCSGLSSTKFAEFCFVYPTKYNSKIGYMGADPEYNTYTKEIENKQKWFREYMYEWKADRLDRSRAMPQIKNYARVSPCLTKLAFYLLTSANFTKTSWGNGAFFDEKWFEIKKTENNENDVLFPFMCDMPLTSYDVEDEPLLHIEEGD